MTDETELIKELDAAYAKKDRKREDVYYTDMARQHAKEHLADRKAELFAEDLVVGTNDKARNASMDGLIKTERQAQKQAEHDHSRALLDYSKAADNVYRLRDKLDFERRDRETR